MAVPARPASGAPIDSVWGGLVHDAAVALDVQSGSTPLPWPSSALSPSTGVVFPRPFAAPPVVVAIVSGGAAVPAPRLTGSVGSITATGFNFQAVETRESAVSNSMFIGWIAIGPRA